MELSEKKNPILEESRGFTRKFEKYRLFCRNKRTSIVHLQPAVKRKGSENMVFNTGAALLDGIVLAAVSKELEGTYGYKITQDVREVLDVSESTLYPVLRRLQKDECLEAYDMAYAGRNRRYYKITERGAAQLQLYKTEWKSYSSKISAMFEGGV